MSFPNLNVFSGLLALDPVFGFNSQLEKRMINSDTGQVLYIGLNMTPGAATSASTWAIAKCSYDGNGFLNYYQLPVSKGFGPYYVWDNVTDYF